MELNFIQAVRKSLLRLVEVNYFEAVREIDKPEILNLLQEL